MYPISPVYANRQYASTEGVFRVHAASKTTAANRSGKEALFDMIMAYNDYVQPSGRDKDSQDGSEGSLGQDRSRKQNDVRSEEEISSASEPKGAGRSGGRYRVTDPYNRTIIADPPDGANISKPFNPYGRFRELGFNADNLPFRPLDSNKQRLHASLLSIYRTPSYPGGRLAVNI